MKLCDLRAEKAFDARIDARFPYDNGAECSALIEEARTISLNAVFQVLDEICRAPVSAPVTRDRQRELLLEWASGMEHELKEPLLQCAKTLIDRKRLSWREAVDVMDQISRFHGQYAALSIACMAGDCDSSEGDMALESTYTRIRQAWEQKDR